jgi:NAD(P)-dependent dehydrogenase (short-subunit alcohol dehydrogenase family)
MVSRKRGSIVLVGSRAAERPWESAKAAAYAASKAAVVALAGAVATEVRPAGVRVNVILPSTIDTPQNRASMPSADPSRWVTPESIGEVAKFLLSDASRDISGAVIPVYGNA